MADIFETGTTATILTSFNACYAKSSANVTFATGANGTGNTVNPSSQDESVAAVLSFVDTLVFNAGSYTGGVSAYDRPAAALASYQDTSVTISGGTFSGAAPGSLMGEPGAVIKNPAAVSITGGTFAGSAAAAGSNSDGGTACVLGLVNSATISGGTFTGGAGDGTGIQGASLGANVPAGKVLTISGGTFSGPNFWANLGSGATIHVWSAVSIPAPIRPSTGGAYSSFIDGMGNTTYS